MEFVVATSLQVFLLFAGLTAFTAAALRSLKIAAVSIILLLPSYLIRIREGLFVTNVLELLILLFLISAAIRVVRRKEEITAPPKALWLPLLLLVVGAGCSAVYAAAQSGSDPETVQSTLGAWKGLFLVPAIFATGIMAVRSIREHLTHLLDAYIVSAAVLAGAAILGGLLSGHLSLVTAFITFDGRLRGFYESPNQLAMYLLPAIVLLAVNSNFPAYRQAGKSQIPNFQRNAILALLGGALLWTQSAGAFLGLAVGLGAFYGFRRFGSRFILHTAYFILLLGLLLPFIGALLAEEAWEEGWRSPLASRLMIWRAGTEMLKTDWLPGIGPGIFQERYLGLQEAFPPYLEWAVPHPHNLLMAIWLSSGLCGLAGFVWLIISAFRNTLTAKRLPLNAIATSVALVAILTHGLVDTTVLKNDLAVVFLLLAAARY